jgi:hypothetical protein
MAFAGETIENPVTKERITFRATMRDTGGGCLPRDVSAYRWGADLVSGCP